MKFQDPLGVVADEFAATGLEDYSDVMWNILDRQDALQGDYTLLLEPADEDALRQTLFEKPDANWDRSMYAYRSDVAAPDISSMEHVRDAPLIQPPGTQAVKEPQAAEKRSVLEQLREVAKAPKEPHKDKPSQSKTEPER